MHILYHHRTTGQDAQGIHIREILRAFEELGHTTELVSFADRPRAGKRSKTERAGSGGKERYTWLARLRGMALVYECAEIAYNFWGFWNLTRAMRRCRPDLLYERYSLFNLSGVLASRIFGVPMVLEVNAPLAHEKEQYEKLTLRRLAYALENWICSHATRTIVVSTPLQKILVQQGVPKEKLVLVQNGVNPGEIETRLGQHDVRLRYGLEDKLVLGFVGWFKPWHRLDAVLELVAARPEWRQKLCVLLVGDGPEAPALRRLVQRLQLDGCVHITGPVSRDRIYDHIDAFDVALQPHVTEYASPMKIFEYLALGKCVVAPDLENIREILTHGEDALLFRPGDAQSMAGAIEVLAQDPELVRRMGENASRKIGTRRYTWVENARRALQAVGLEEPPKRSQEPDLSPSTTQV